MVNIILAAWLCFVCVSA